MTRIFKNESGGLADETYFEPHRTGKNDEAQPCISGTPAAVPCRLFRSRDGIYAEALVRQWPTFPKEALFGIAGEIVELATLDSEADPAAILMTVLVYASAYFGSHRHVGVGETKHPARLMSVLVGATSRARKGTSAAPVVRIFKVVNQKLGSPLQVSHGPLSTGEGLISAVRDESERKSKEGCSDDPGVRDKRLLVIEEELGAPLKAMQREGNTLSSILRNAWDHGDIAPLTKSNRIKVTGAHICIIGHITIAELTGLLQSVDIWNGFANRFLWLCVKRQKLVAVPRSMPDEAVEIIATRIAAIISASQETGPVRLHPDVETAWTEHYPKISQDAGGVFGTVTARAEAHVMRLALVYTLLDGQNTVSLRHFQAALSLWQYCYCSARYIFGNAESDKNAARILMELSKGEKTQTQLNDSFNGHLSAKILGAILSELQALGRVNQRKQGGGKGKGKPKTLWRLAEGFDCSTHAEMEDFE